MKPITLIGDVVRLEPMKLSHLDDLYSAGRAEDIWKWTTSNVASREDMFKYVEAALGDAGKGTALPFVTVEKASGKIIGSTRFGNIDKSNRRTEIGWTWIDPKWQRTAVNTEAKLLMLTHAFEVWNCIRVELKTDVLNERSRAAILRLGAKEEGVFRNHMIIDSGRFRDSIYFSIIETEWPDIRKGLLEKLEKRK